MKTATAHAQAELLTEPASGVKELQTVDRVPAEGGNLTMFERLAKDPAVDVEKLQRLIDMQKDIMRVNAEQAFNLAFSDLQAVLPTIIEKSFTDKTTYAPIEDIVDAVRPKLKEHGFSLSFRTEWPEKGIVKVIGILTHADGHARTSEFQAAADQTGSKNQIQAFGSSVSYGRRYTTTDLLCIVSRKASAKDDDGEGTERPDAPAGFEAWGLELEAATTSGTAALMKAFNGGAEPLRLHLVKQHKASWESLKTRAADVTKKGGRS